MNDQLRKHLIWVYGDDRCTCPHVWMVIGEHVDFSVNHGWVRKSDAPDCPHHRSDDSGVDVCGL